MKKVCLVIPSLKVGGMERVMSQLANYFSAKDDVIVTLIVLAKTQRFYEIEPKVKVIEPEFKFNSRWRIIYSIRTILFLRRNVKALMPDAVLSFGEMFNSFVLLGTKFLKIRIFVSDRSRPNIEMHSFHKFFRKKIYRSATGIISQTEYSKKFLIQEIKHENIKVIPNPVAFFEWNVVERKNIIITVGRLVTTKRIELLIDIFSQINSNDWELWIVGDGPQKNRLIEKSNYLRISSKVKFFGNQLQINDFYSVSKIFAFVSSSEGFPNVLLEAMSNGLACISFDCVAGPSELIQHEYNGFLIPDNDINLYSEKLRELMKSEELRHKFSENAKARSLDFNIEIIGEAYLKFLIN